MRRVRFLREGVFEERQAVPARGNELIIPMRWLLWLLAFSSMIVFLMLHYVGMAIDPSSHGFVAITAAMLVLGLIRYPFRRPTTALQAGIKNFCENTLLFMGFTLLGVLATYPAAGSTTAFADPVLARADQLLHFDWLSWYREVSEHPVLQRIGVTAYAMIYVSPAILIAYFAATGRQAEARRFLFAFWLAAFLTLLLFPLFPAEGPLAYLWRGDIPYMPTSALYQHELIPVLRRHELHEIDLGALRGLVCAPSFHTVSAVLYIATAWPLKRLRWLVVPVNIAMLLSTPVEGTHYLIDMIAGLAVALVALWLVRLMLRHMSVQDVLHRDVPVLAG